MTPVRSLCVYCGASVGRSPALINAAKALGAGLAARNIRLVYGGGKVGIMGVLADATLAGGGQVTGVIPNHLQDTEVGHGGVTELKIVDSMHTRKRTMFELADGFVILPGGLGTLDETFEIITWKQLGLHDKPIVLADIDGYWTPLRALIEAIIDNGFARRSCLDLFEVVDSVPAIFETFAAAPVPRGEAHPGRM